MELQANRFAACLLMPGFLVQATWLQRFNNLQPVFVENRRSTAPELRLLLPSAVRDLGASTSPIAQRALEELITDIAREFRTSRRAMRIRLQQLGLLFP
jgi:Zn-dependent peptidase ImmA (M78 family)